MIAPQRVGRALSTNDRLSRSSKNSITLNKEGVNGLLLTLDNAEMISYK